MTREDCMREALREAELALAAGELPVGCVIVRNGEIVARGHNERERTGDPTAHAEIVALRRAAAAAKGWRLTGAEMYVTLEPCPMCAGAVLQARVAHLYYGAADPEQGCAGSVYRIPEDPAFAHFCPSVGGLLRAECEALLKRFFAAARGHGDMDLATLTLSDLQPSQFCVSGAKLAEVRTWFRPENLENFAPIPVKALDGRPVMTDGHTRAVAALLAGLERVPLAWEDEELDWDMYRACVRACRDRGVRSPADLTSRVVSPEAYAEVWDAWCDRMQAAVRAEREKKGESRG